MKTINYVCCALTVFLCLTSMVRSETAEKQFLEEMLKVKRPFCNAFTGCGRKRSFHEMNPSEPQDLESATSVRLPLSIYKALLRAASQNIRNTIDRETTDYQVSGMPQIYLSSKAPLQKRFNQPATFLD